MSTPGVGPVGIDDTSQTVRNFVRSGEVRSDTCTPVSPNTATPTPDCKTRPAPAELPEVGTEFLSFRLVRELGRGACGRVFLATQGELAGRLVALKVSVDVTGESRSLAQLQHTNIVPVYSVHHDRGVHAVCMPYFGSTTLADLLRHRRGCTPPPATGAELVNRLRELVAARPLLSPTSTAPAEPPQTETVYARLTGMTFVQAVCWMMARVADGLAHAHDRGIVHRDVKPANVLVADDGQPMLLDFGVAADLKARVTAEAVGGTIPYMAPEQLADLFTTTAPADPRSDVYAVGVILYEWLTGTHPFTPPGTDLAADLPRLLAERQGWVPNPRAVLPGLSPDLEAIIRTCTAPDPARRYQSAAQLSEDLRRHLADEPLLVAPEPFGWGRVQKWRRRHPKLGGSMLTVGVAVVSLGACVEVMHASQMLNAARAEQAQREEEYARELDRLAAVRQLADAQRELRNGRYLFAGQVLNQRDATANLTPVRAILSRYGLPDDPDWRSRPAVTALPADRQQELYATLSDACLLVARGYLQLEDDRVEAARKAERYNALAQAIDPDSPARAVFTQRAEIFRRLGRPIEADAALAEAADTPLQAADDYFLSGDEALAGGRCAEAGDLYRTAVGLDPTHFWAQFQLGVCEHRLGRPAEARACYSAAIALQPDFPWAYYNRAIATVALRNPTEVVRDLTTALELEPQFPLARLHRAHAYAQLNEYQAALADLAAVLSEVDPGGMHVRALLQRAELKRETGDAAGAAADTAAALPLEPTDEVGWLLRGLARVEDDPAAALADIEQAVRQNPRSVSALQNQVYMLERLGRYDDAVGVMNRLFELTHPTPQLTASRGALLARLGRFDEAVRDATAALANTRVESVRAQVVVVYSLASVKKPELRAEAIRLLGELVADGYPTSKLAEDADLAPLRDDPAFQKLIGGK